MDQLIILSIQQMELVKFTLGENQEVHSMVFFVVGIGCMERVRVRLLCPCTVLLRSGTRTLGFVAPTEDEPMSNSYGNQRYLEV